MVESLFVVMVGESCLLAGGVRSDGDRKGVAIAGRSYAARASLYLSGGKQGRRFPNAKRRRRARWRRCFDLNQNCLLTRNIAAAPLN
jgi:hypothetical protein